MNKLLAALAVTTALFAPSLAMAKTVNISGQMANYQGQAAYLAIYVTDAAGTFQRTLYVGGTNARYYRDMRAWARGVATVGRLDGITGASVGSGRSFSVSVEIADALIDAGYQIRVDSAVENGQVFAATPTIPLAQSSSGQAFTGSGYVAALTVAM